MIPYDLPHKMADSWGERFRKRNRPFRLLGMRCSRWFC